MSDAMLWYLQLWSSSTLVETVYTFINRSILGLYAFIFYILHNKIYIFT